MSGLRKLWLRLYTAILDNPKLQLLSDRHFRLVINLWCIAKENDGVLPPPDRCAFRLRMKTERFKTEFASVSTLFDGTPDGCYIPHDWNEHQYQSDVSTDRVKRWREQQCNVSCNDDGNTMKRDETPRARPRASESVSESVSCSESDGEKESERKGPEMRREFDEQWQEFERLGAAVFPAGPKDWDKAWGIQWRYLDGLQRQAALDGLRARVGHTDDAAYKSQPVNWLEGRKWQRPVQRAKARPITETSGVMRAVERFYAAKNGAGADQPLPMLAKPKDIA